MWWQLSWWQIVSTNLWYLIGDNDDNLDGPWWSQSAYPSGDDLGGVNLCAALWHGANLYILNNLKCRGWHGRSRSLDCAWCVTAWTWAAGKNTGFVRYVAWPSTVFGEVLFKRKHGWKTASIVSQVCLQNTWVARIHPTSFLGTAAGCFTTSSLALGSSSLARNTHRPDDQWWIVSFRSVNERHTQVQMFASQGFVPFFGHCFRYRFDHCTSPDLLSHASMLRYTLVTNVAAAEKLAPSHHYIFQASTSIIFLRWVFRPPAPCTFKIQTLMRTLCRSLTSYVSSATAGDPLLLRHLTLAKSIRAKLKVHFGFKITRSTLHWWPWKGEISDCFVAVFLFITCSGYMD